MATLNPDDLASFIPPATRVDILMIGGMPEKETDPSPQMFISSEPDMTPAQWRRLGEQIMKAADEGYQQVNMNEIVSNDASEDEPG